MLKAEHLIHILQFQLSKGRGSNVGKAIEDWVLTVLTRVLWERLEFWGKDILLSLPEMVTFIFLNIKMIHTLVKIGM